jgi:hypothetical protein
LEFFEDGHVELYNVREDVGQKQDLAKSQPEKAKELHDKLVAWRASVDAPMPTKREPGQDSPAKKKGKKGKRKAKGE